MSFFSGGEGAGWKGSCLNLVNCPSISKFPLRGFLNDDILIR